jgi:hypothetical protein
MGWWQVAGLSWLRRAVACERSVLLRKATRWPDIVQIRGVAAFAAGVAIKMITAMSATPIAISTANAAC